MKKQLISTKAKMSILSLIMVLVMILTQFSSLIGMSFAYQISGSQSANGTTYIFPNDKEENVFISYEMIANGEIVDYSALPEDQRPIGRDNITFIATPVNNSNTASTKLNATYKALLQAQSGSDEQKIAAAFKILFGNNWKSGTWTQPYETVADLNTKIVAETSSMSTAQRYTFTQADFDVMYNVNSGSNPTVNDDMYDYTNFSAVANGESHASVRGDMSDFALMYHQMDESYNGVPATWCSERGVALGSYLYTIHWFPNPSPSGYLHQGYTNADMLGLNIAANYATRIAVENGTVKVISGDANIYGDTKMTALRPRDGQVLAYFAIQLFNWQQSSADGNQGGGRAEGDYTSDLFSGGTGSLIKGVTPLQYLRSHNMTDTGIAKVKEFYGAIRLGAQQYMREPDFDNDLSTASQLTLGQWDNETAAATYNKTHPEARMNGDTEHNETHPFILSFKDGLGRGIASVILRDANYVTEDGVTTPTTDIGFGELNQEPLQFKLMPASSSNDNDKFREVVNNGDGTYEFILKDVNPLVAKQNYTVEVYRSDLPVFESVRLKDGSIDTTFPGCTGDDGGQMMASASGFLQKTYTLYFELDSATNASMTKTAEVFRQDDDGTWYSLGTGAAIEPGDRIRYTIAVTNDVISDEQAAMSPLVDFWVWDPIPAGTKYVPGTLKTVKRNSNNNFVEIVQYGDLNPHGTTKEVWASKEFVADPWVEPNGSTTALHVDPVTYPVVPYNCTNYTLAKFGLIDPNDTQYMVFDVEVSDYEADKYPMQIENVAYGGVHGEGNWTTNTVTNSRAVPPEITVSKRADPEHGSIVKENDGVHYTITLNNPTGSKVKNQEISDVIPPGMTLKTSGGTFQNIPERSYGPVKVTITNKKGLTYVNTLPLKSSRYATTELTTAQATHTDTAAGYYSAYKSRNGDIYYYPAANPGSGTEAEDIGELYWFFDIPSGIVKIEFEFDVQVDPLTEGMTYRQLLNRLYYNGSWINDTEHYIYGGTVSASKYSDKTDGALVHENETITYTIAVRNNGAGEQRNIHIKDSVPNGTTFVSFGTPVYKNPSTSSDAVANPTAPSPTTTAAPFEWVIPILEPGQEVLLTFTVRVNPLEPGESMSIIENTAFFNDNPTNQVIHYQPGPDIGAIKRSDPASGSIVKEDDVITYYIDVYNNGGEYSDQIIVEDYIPDNTTYVDGSAGLVASSVPEGMTSSPTVVYTPEENSSTGTSTTQSKGKITWTIGTTGTQSTMLPPGESVTLTFKVKVDRIHAGVFDSRTFLNKATVEHQNVVVETNTTEHYMYPSKVVATKSSMPTSGSTVFENDIITYQIEVVNNGSEIAHTTTVSDAIPYGTKYVAGSANVTTSSGYTYNASENTIDTSKATNGDTTANTGSTPTNGSGNDHLLAGFRGLVYTLTELKPGEKRILEFKVQVQRLPDGIDSRSFDNTAYVYNDTNEKIETNTTTHFQSGYNVYAEKSAVPVEGTKVTENDIIEYWIEIGNNGADYAYNIPFLDQIPEGTKYEAGTLKVVGTKYGTTAVPNTVATVDDSHGADATNPRLSATIHKLAKDTVNNDGDYARLWVTFKVRVQPMPENVEQRDIINHAHVGDFDTNTVRHIQTNFDLVPVKRAYVTEREDTQTADVTGQNGRLLETPLSGVNNTVHEDDLITYELDVTNHGSDTAYGKDMNGDGVGDGVLVTDQIPIGTRYVGGSASRGTIQVINTMTGETRNISVTLLSEPADGAKSGEIRWKIAGTITDKNDPNYQDNGLKANEKVTIIFQVYADFLAAGENSTVITNQFYADQRASNIVEFTVGKDMLSIRKESNPVTESAVREGDVIHYKLVIENNGDSKARDVYVRDMIPQYTTYVPGSAYVKDSPTGTSEGDIQFKWFTTTHASTVTTGGTMTSSGESEGAWEAYWATGNTSDPDPTLDETASGYLAQINAMAARSARELAWYFPQFEIGRTYEIYFDVTVDAIPVVPRYDFGYQTWYDEARADEDETVINPNDPNGLPITNDNDSTPSSLLDCADSLMNGGEVTRKITNYAELISKNTQYAFSRSNETHHTVTKARLEYEKWASPVSGSRVRPGQEITYTIRIKNTGTAPDYNIKIVDPIPEGTWFVDGSIVSDGDAKGTWNTSRITNISNTIYAGLYNAYGSTFFDRLQVGRVEWTIDQLDPGEELYLSFKALVLPIPYAQADESVLITNQAYIKGYDTDKLGTSSGWGYTNETKHTTRNNRVDIEKTANTESQISTGTTHTAYINGQEVEGGIDNTQTVLEGEQITYYLYVTNYTGSIVTYVPVWDSIPDGTTYVDGSATQGGKLNKTEPDYRVEWTIRYILPGQTYKLQYKVTVNELPDGLWEKTLMNVALTGEGGADGPDTPFIPSNQILHKVVKPKIVPTKSSDPESGEQVYAGSTITYTITLENKTSDIIRYIPVQDLIPTGTTYVDGSAKTSDNVNFSGVLTDSDGVVTTLNWVVRSIAPGQSETVTFDVTVKALSIGQPTRTIKNYALAGNGGDSMQNPGTPNIKTNEVWHTVIPPKVTLRKESTPTTGTSASPAAVTPGSTITYYLYVTNDTEERLYNVPAYDQIPAGTTWAAENKQPKYEDGDYDVEGQYLETSQQVIWEIPEIAAGDTVKLAFAVTVDGLPEGVSAVNIINTGVVANKATNKTYHKAENPAVYGVKTAEAPHQSGTRVTVGAYIDYVITVHNNNNTAVTQVEVYDYIPTGTTYISGLAESYYSGSYNATEKKVYWTIPSIAANSTEVVKFRVQVNSLNGEDYRTIENKAYVNEVETNHTYHYLYSAENYGIKEVYRDGIKLEYGEFVKAGDILTYRINLYNTLPQEQEFTITDVIPDGTTLHRNASDYSATLDTATNKLTWAHVRVPANTLGTQSVEFDVIVKTLDNGITMRFIDNQATVNSIPTNKTRNPQVGAILDFEKTGTVPNNTPVTDTRVREGDTILYTIRVKNLGFENSEVVVQDYVPAGTHIDTTYTISHGGQYDAGANRVTWKFDGTTNAKLTPNQEVYVTFRVIVDSLPTGRTQGTINNAGLVNGTQTNVVTHVVEKSHITAVKRANPPTESDVTEGQTISFYIDVYNDGGIEARNIRIKDTVQEGFRIVNGSIKIDGVLGGTKTEKDINWTIPKIENGGKVTVSYDVVVEALPTNTSEMWVENYALYNQGGDEEPEEKTNTTRHNVTKVKYRYEKTADPMSVERDENGEIITDSVVAVGSQIKYTITLSNDGSRTAYNTPITDYIPAGTKYVADSLEFSPGAYGFYNDTKKRVEGMFPEIAPAQGGAFGGKVWMTFTVEVLDSAIAAGSTTGTIKNKATIDERFETNETEHTVIAPDITAEKFAKPGVIESPVPDGTPEGFSKIGTEVNPGDIIEYKIVVTNNSDLPAYNVPVMDVIPQYVEYVPGSASYTSGELTYTESDRRLYWIIDVIPAGGSKEVSFKVECGSVPATKASVSISNAAWYGQGGGTDTNPKSADMQTNTVNHTLKAASLVIWKEANPASGTSVELGQEIRYTIHVRNDSDYAATGINIADPISYDFDFDSVNNISSSGASAGGNGVKDTITNSIVWENQTINAHTEALYEFSIEVNEDGVSQNFVTNYALVNDRPTNTTVHYIGSISLPTWPPFTWPPFPSLSVDVTITWPPIDFTWPPIPDPDWTFPPIEFTWPPMPEGWIGTWPPFEFTWPPIEFTWPPYTTYPGGSTENVSLIKSANHANGSEVPLGEEITYTLVVNNDTDEAIYNVEVFDGAPAGTHMKSGGTGGGTPLNDGSGLYKWTIATIPAHSSSTAISFTVIVDTEQNGRTTIVNDAYMTSSIGYRVSNQVSHKIIIPAGDDLDVHKLANPTSGQTVNVGGDITYIIRVTNNTSAAMNNVQIRDIIPAGTTFVSSEWGSVTNGEFSATITIPAKTTLDVTFKVKVNELSPTQTGRYDIANQAFVTFNGKTTGTETTIHTVYPEDGPQPLKIEKAANPASGSVVPAGSQIDYTIIVTNPGATDKTNVTVTDPLPLYTDYKENSAKLNGVYNSAYEPVNGVITWSNITVPARSSVTLTFSVIPQALPSNATTARTISNQATMKYDGNTDASNPVIHVITPTSSGILKLEKSANPAEGTQVVPGQHIVYSIVVTNTTTAAMTNVVVTDNVPEGTAYDNANGGDVNGTHTNGVVRWDIGTLNAGSSKLVKFEVIVQAGTNEIHNRAQASYTSDGENGTSYSNETVHPRNNGRTYWTFRKTSTPASGSTVNSGSYITYFLTVENLGSSTISNIEISDTIPSGTQFVTGSASDGATPVGSTLSWTIGSIAPYGYVQKQFTVKVVNDTQQATIVRNNATATVGTETKTSETTHTVLPPEVIPSQPTKEANPVHGSTVYVDDYILYTIKVPNNTDSTISGVTVTDDVPAEIEFISSPTGTANSAKTRITWTNVSIAPHSYAQLTWVGKVNGNATKDTIIRNTANVTWSNGTTTQTNEVDHVSGGGRGNDWPGDDPIVLRKSAYPSEGTVVQKGETITYTLTLSNYGTDTQYGVTVSDELPVWTTYVSSPGGTFLPYIGLTYHSPGVVTWSNLTVPVGTNTVTLYVTVRVKDEFRYYDESLAQYVDVDVKFIDNEANYTYSGGSGKSNVVTHLLPEDGTPSVTLTKEANPVSGTPRQAGEYITYTLKLHNSGTVPVTDVYLYDYVPYGTTVSNPYDGTVSGWETGSNTGNAEVPYYGRIISWDNITIPAGDTVTKYFQVRVDDPYYGSGTISNEAYYLYSGGSGTSNRVEHPVPRVNGDLYIYKYANPSSGQPVTTGQDITYTLYVQNTGNTTLTNVTVNDVVPSGTQLVSSDGVASTDQSSVTWNIGTLAVGQSTTKTFTVKVLSGTNTIYNTATGNGNSNGSTIYAFSNTTQHPRMDIRKDFEVTKDSTPDNGATVNNGSYITYFVTIRNTGTVALNGLTISDTIPSGTTLAGSPSNGGVAYGNSVVWNNISLPVGGSYTVNFVVVVAELTAYQTYNQIRNTARGSGEGLDKPSNEVIHNLVTTPTPPPNETPTPYGISADKTANPASGSSVFKNSEITYTITVYNNTDTDAYNTIVTDSIPYGTTWVSGGSYNNGIVTLNAGTVTRRSYKQVSFVVRVNGDTTHGQTIANQAWVSTSNLGSTNTNTVWHTVYDPPSALQILKSASPTEGTPVSAGSQITYYLTVRNAGVSNLNNITVTDYVPSGTTYVSGGNHSNGVVTFNYYGTLAPGATTTFNFTVNVQSGTSVIYNTATGYGYNQNGTRVDGTSNTTQHPRSTVPPTTDFTIEKYSNPEAGSTVSAGDNITYFIKVTNTGTTALTQFPIWDYIAEGVTLYNGSGNPSDGGIVSGNLIHWTIPSIPVGQSKTVSFIVTVDSGYSGILHNKAYGGNGKDTPDDPLIVDPTPTPTPTAPVTPTPNPGANLTATKSNNPTNGEPVVAGQQITYTIVVRNDTAYTATNVLVTDIVPYGTTFLYATENGYNNNGVVTWNIGTMGAYSQKTLTFVATVNSNTYDGQYISNQALVTWNGGNTNTNVVTNVVRNTGGTLVINKSANPANGTPVQSGQDITYTLEVHNYGQTALNNVIITDQVPTGTEFVSAYPTASNNNGTLTWYLGTLPANGNATLNFIVRVTASGTTIYNTAHGSATGSNGTINVDSNTVIHPGTPISPWTVNKTSNPANGSTVTPGTPITYYITVNNPNSTPITATIVDNVPQYTTISGTPSDGGQLSGSTIVWSNLTIPAGGKTVSFTVTAGNPPAGYSYWITRNIATVTSGGETKNTPEVVINIQNPNTTGGLTIEKSANPSNGTQVGAGMNITYYLRVRNQGNTAVYGAVVTDAIPANTTLLTGTINPITGYNNNGTITWNLGTVPVGYDNTFSFTVRVNDNVSGGYVYNQATTTWTGTENGGGSGSDISDPIYNPIGTNVSNITAYKSSATSTGSYTVATNDIITYTITVTNSGNTTAYGVPISDTIPNYTHYVAGSAKVNGIQSGSYNSLTNKVEWSIASIAANTSVVVQFQVQVDTIPSNITVTSIRNTAYYGPGGSTTPTTPTNEVENPIGGTTPISNLTVTKSSSAGNNTQVTAGQTLVYTITVTNTGTAASGIVTVTDTIPYGLTYQSSSPYGINNNGTVTWTLPSIAAGQSATITVSTTVNALPSGTTYVGFNNVAVANGTASNPVFNYVQGSDSSGLITGVKTANPANGSTVTSGQTVTYYINLTNSSSQTKTAVVTDVVPEGTTLVQNSISDGGTANGNVITWNVTLNGGATKQLSFNVTVNSLASGQSRTISNQATIVTQGSGGGTSSTNTVIHNQNNGGSGGDTYITINVTTNIGSNTTVYSGNTIIYYLTVNNYGNSSTVVNITNPIPGGTQYINNTANYGGYVINNILTWNNLTIPANSSVQLQFAVMVLDGSGSIYNVAYINGNTPSNSIIIYRGDGSGSTCSCGSSGSSSCSCGTHTTTGNCSCGSGSCGCVRSTSNPTNSGCSCSSTSSTNSCGCNGSGTSNGSSCGCGSSSGSSGSGSTTNNNNNTNTVNVNVDGGSSGSSGSGTVNNNNNNNTVTVNVPGTTTSNTSTTSNNNNNNSSTTSSSGGSTTGSGTTTTSNNNNNNSSSSSSSSSGYYVPKTGESSVNWAVLMFILSGAGLIVLLIPKAARKLMGL